MSPSTAAWQKLISALHASGRKAALALTGGGSGAVGELLRVPGGSRLLIEAQVPYDEHALAAFLGFAPAQACSADTAIAMARTARARACGISAPSPRSLFDADEHYAETVVAAADTIDRLLAGELDRVTVQPDGQMMLSAPQPFVLYPGSFNPMHEGHASLARVAEELRQQPLAFELSVTNVDKPPLAGETVKHRLAQFAWKSPVELTRAPTFVEKSRLFPGATFVVGADTAERLFAPKYYGDDETQMHMALEEIANSGASFLVAVRIDAAGRIRALNDIAVPRRYAGLFTEIPEHRFRVDTSSSEIRARRRAVGNS